MRRWMATTATPKNITLDVEIDGVPVTDDPPPPDHPEPGVIRGESRPASYNFV